MTSDIKDQGTYIIMSLKTQNVIETYSVDGQTWSAY